MNIFACVNDAIRTGKKIDKRSHLKVGLKKAIENGKNALPAKSANCLSPCLSSTSIN